MLYTGEQVYELIKQDKCLLFDIRDDIDYLEGHIPKAISAPDIFYYLTESSPQGLKSFQNFFSNLFSEAGLSSDKLAIIYEYNMHDRYGGSCRGYYILKYLGHKNVGILDGGFRAWQKGGFPINKITQTFSPAEFKTKLNPNIIATKDDVLSAMNNQDTILLDIRDKIERIGESSSPYGIDFAPRKGIIPSSKWIEWYDFMNKPGESPTFKSSAEIEEICAGQNIFKNSNIILYCFKGARASNSFVALKLAGFKNVRIYFASWNEWSRDFSLPIEK